MDYHPVVSRIKNLLQQNALWFDVFEHEPVRTSEEAAQVRTGYTLEQGAKALVVRIKISEKSKKFVMLVVPAHKRFDNAKVKAYFGAKDVRFATEKEVFELTEGVQVGGVPPFGNLFEFEVYCDPELLLNEKIIFNAGDRRYSIAMKAADYQKLVKPVVTPLV